MKISRALLINLFVFIVMFGGAAMGASGDLDPTFAASAYGLSNGNVSVIKFQTDGKMLAGGFFTEVNGYASSGLVRLNLDGSVDTSFNAPEFFGGTGIGGQILSMAIQPDGKILVGGDYWYVNNVFAPGMRRLNADGSIDTTFTVVQFAQGGIISDIEIQADGKIIAGGQFQTTSQTNIGRFNQDGSRDMTFETSSAGMTVNDVLIQPDGKIVFVGTNGIKRFNSNGTADPTFVEPFGVGGVLVVALMPNGQYLIGGSFTNVNNFPQGRIARINADGSLDLDFNLNMAGANGPVNEIVVRPDGKILIAGSFSTYNTVTAQKLLLLNTNGSQDTSFQSGTTLSQAPVNDIEVDSAGSIFAGIQSSSFYDRSLIKFSATGAFDGTFFTRLLRNGQVIQMARQPDGKILAAGWYPFFNGVKRNSLARINPDGSLDASFVPYFNNSAQIVLNSVAVQSDGKVLAGSSSGVMRMNADGTQDTSFVSGLQSNSLVDDIAVLTNGQIILGGNMQAPSTRYLLRLNANGSIDTTFAPQPNGLVRRVLVQGDGKIMIGGDFGGVGASIRGRIARLNSDGSLDNSFNPPGGANGTVDDIVVQQDGRVLLAGQFSALNGNTTRTNVGRLNADGTLDISFAQQTNGAVISLVVQPDKKILIGGSMSNVGGVPHNGMARLNVNGTLDTTFNPFVHSSVFDMDLLPDGKILICGEFTKVNNRSAVRMARLQNSIAPSRTLFDYDGDGKADVSVFRASENQWYILRSSDFGVTQSTFAIANDIPVPADFDGDGKTDVAIFRPSNGNWWSLSSSNGQQVNFPLGQAGDIPLPSDIDGDGRADYVIFRPATNQWFRASSANGAGTSITFGLAGDKPVIGDFDGDSKSDIAIYRPGDGNWWWQSSIDGVQRATRWGIATDIPAPADYDGDGKTDFAVFRPSTGVWYVLNSGGGSPLIGPFGLTGDKPVPADYDGDGKADLAVFRPSDRIWYLLRSTSGFTGFQFGIATDVPTQNAFIQ